MMTKIKEYIRNFIIKNEPKLIENKKRKKVMVLTHDLNYFMENMDWMLKDKNKKWVMLTGRFIKMKRYSEFEIFAQREKFDIHVIRMAKPLNTDRLRGQLADFVYVDKNMDLSTIETEHGWMDREFELERILRYSEDSNKIHYF